MIRLPNNFLKDSAIKIIKSSPVIQNILITGCVSISWVAINLETSLYGQVIIKSSRWVVVFKQIIVLSFLEQLHLIKKIKLEICHRDNSCIFCLGFVWRKFDQLARLNLDNTDNMFWSQNISERPYIYTSLPFTFKWKYKIMNCIIFLYSM